ncbi:MAG: DUF72 domain-containing protein [Bacteroidia bacterium]|nr:DUF72 domain-containing protein [Bacteroidia bacterium]
MKFGKLTDISQVDFSLPPINEATLQRLGGKPAENSFQAFIGLPRWASKDWIGQLFPPKTKQADFLYHYSLSFNTIELNTTHYRIPTPDQVSKWAEQASDDFVFCPKVPQVISHYRKLINCDEEIYQFTESIRHFGKKMGCSFVQLHESFGLAQLDNLKDFVKNWPADLPISFEFRHADWFEAQQVLPELIETLTSHRMGMVITDVSGRRDVLHTDLSNKTAMIRLVGNELHPSDYARAELWLDRLEVWVKNGLETLYLFPHQPEDPQAADFGKFIIEGLNRKFDLNLNIPGIPKKPGNQMSLF